MLTGPADSGRQPPPQSLIRLALPFPNRHSRALSKLGHDLEFVNQAAHSWKAQTQAPRCGISLSQVLFNTRDAWPLVTCDDHNSLSVGIMRGSRHDPAPPGIQDDVAGQFVDCLGKQSRIPHRKTQFRSQRSTFVASNYDILIRDDRNMNFAFHSSSQVSLHNSITD